MFQFGTRTSGFKPVVQLAFVYIQTIAALVKIAAGHTPPGVYEKFSHIKFHKSMRLHAYTLSINAVNWRVFKG